MGKSLQGSGGAVALAMAWAEAPVCAGTSARQILARIVACRVRTATCHGGTHERHHRSRRPVAARRMPMYVGGDGHDESSLEGPASIGKGSTSSGVPQRGHCKGSHALSASMSSTQVRGLARSLVSATRADPMVLPRVACARARVRERT